VPDELTAPRNVVVSILRSSKVKATPAPAGHPNKSTSPVAPPRGIPQDEFDVVYELKNNRDNYYVAPGDEHFDLSIVTFPSACDQAVKVIRKKVGGSRAVGMQPTMACCISNGVDVMYGNADIKLLLDSRDRFDAADPDRDGDEISMVVAWFKAYGMEGSDRNVSMARSDERLNVKLPIGLGLGLKELSTELGASVPTMSIMAAMITLGTQTCVNRDHRREMQYHVKRFMKRASVRARATRAILAEFGL
jgi:hypothetical protein